MNSPLSRALAPLACLLLAASCTQPSRSHDAGEPEHPDVELSVLMGEIQRHSAKLGYSIAANNQKLAEFYLTETEEVLDEVRQIEIYEGFPIREALEKILDPILPGLEQAIAEEEWTASWDAYVQLVDGCNRCHAATEHEFLVVLPAEGEPPYLQRFEPGEIPVSPAPSEE